MDRETLDYSGMFGTEELALRVSSYRQNGRLYVGLDYREGGDFLPYTDLTVNLPDEPAGRGEAFIKDFDENEGMLEFIQMHRLDRLKELDGAGTEGYLRLEGAPAKQRPHKCIERQAGR